MTTCAAVSGRSLPHGSSSIRIMHQKANPRSGGDRMGDDGVHPFLRGLRAPDRLARMPPCMTLATTSVSIAVRRTAPVLAVPRLTPDMRRPTAMANAVSPDRSRWEPSPGSPARRCHRSRGASFHRSIARATSVLRVVSRARPKTALHARGRSRPPTRFVATDRNSPPRPCSAIPGASDPFVRRARDAARRGTPVRRPRARPVAVSSCRRRRGIVFGDEERAGPCGRDC